VTDTGHDVIVIGLGGMGSAAAWHLSRRGQRVLGIERFGPAHDRGSSHGATRMIRQAYFEDPAYVPLLLRAYELWDDLTAQAGHPMIHRTGGLMIGDPASTAVVGALASARAHDLPHELLDSVQIRRRYPTLTPAVHEVAFYEDNAGWVRPEDTVRTHLDLARRAGADLLFDTPVVGWDTTGRGVTVSTPDAVHTADRVVITAGAWAPQLLQRVGLPLTVERQVQHWYNPAGGLAAFTGHPVYIWEDPDGVQFYGFPAVDGPDGGVKVAFFRRGRVTDPDALDTTVSAAEIEEMTSWVRDRVPGLAGTHLRAEPCLYTNTPDQDFVIDHLPGHPEVVIAAGFSGHGFKFVPVVGELLADLGTNGASPLPHELFSTSRFTTTATSPTAAATTITGPRGSC